MRRIDIRLAAALIAVSIFAAGCGHKLVASAGEPTVSVYPDEDTWQKVADLKKQGGMAGMIGGFGQSLAAKQVEDKTPVNIISSDDKGSVIEITDGPNKGVKGFVPKGNVD
ncbi:MAG TPA: hypothetical protein VEF03_12870 [Candidatus Binataceae bacterium]|nr:hypothetical protein [Candidatus Binataceae bacterium]